MFENILNNSPMLQSKSLSKKLPKLEPYGWTSSVCFALYCGYVERAPRISYLLSQIGPCLRHHCRHLAFLTCNSGGLVVLAAELLVGRAGISDSSGPEEARYFWGRKSSLPLVPV